MSDSFSARRFAVITVLAYGLGFQADTLTGMWGYSLQPLCKWGFPLPNAGCTGMNSCEGIVERFQEILRLPLWIHYTNA
ncbi:MAG: hypothetical protein J6I40_03260 [Mailhella sp.]|nr:hypothetical protein [Mailhella sp.]